VSDGRVKGGRKEGREEGRKEGRKGGRQRRVQRMYPPPTDRGGEREHFLPWV